MYKDIMKLVNVIFGKTVLAENCLYSSITGTMKENKEF